MNGSYMTTEFYALARSAENVENRGNDRTEGFLGVKAEYLK